MKQQRGNRIIGCPFRLFAALVLVNLVVLGSGCGKKPDAMPGVDAEENQKLSNGPASSLVPADADGFLYVDVASVWQSPPIKEARKLIEFAPDWVGLANDMATGIPFEQTRSLAFIQFGSYREFSLRVVVANRDLEAEKLTPKLFPYWGPDTQTVEYKGKRIQAQPLGVKKGKELPADAIGVCFLNKRQFLLGTLKNMKRYIDWFEQGPTKGPMTAALALADKHQVYAVVGRSAIQPQLEREWPADLLPLLEAKQAAVALDLSSTIQLETRFDFADEAAARKSAQAAEARLDRAKVELLAPIRKLLKQDPRLEGMFGAACANVEQAVNAAEVKQAGNSIELALAARFPIKIDMAALRQMRAAADRATSVNNLRQLGLAFHIWPSRFGGKLLPAAICDKDGKPLLSWRVLLLPYLDEKFLYEQFKLDEPWDSPRNKLLLANYMPEVFKSPGAQDHGKHLTHYRLFVGPDTLYPGKPGKPVGAPIEMGVLSPFKLAGIPDGVSNTILLVEAEEGVPWTRPEPLPYDARKPLPKMYDRDGVFLTGLMDGSVSAVSIKAPEKSLRSAIMPADGKPLPKDLFDR